MAQNHATNFPKPKLSKHAAHRQRQRCLRDAALEYVLTHGTHIRRTGVTFVVLRWRDIPNADRRVDRWVRLVGTVVILGDQERIVTTYRNRDALQDIRQKTKHSRNGRRLVFEAGK
jgi:hypothetical protein